jgi:hypothetical protein
MKKILASEEFCLFAAAVYILHRLNGPMPYGWLIPVFFLPDVFAAGYFFSKKTGAVLYNFSNHKGVALLMVAAGFFLDARILQLGVLFFAHSSFDRSVGYGLKYFDSSEHTHLGYVGKAKHLNPPDYF